MEDRRAHGRIDKMDVSISELKILMHEHAIYIKENARLQSKNSDDIDILKEDLRENKEFNKRTADASEDVSRDMKEMISLFKGSKNIASTIKYVGFFTATILAIWHFGKEAVTFIIIYFRGY